MLCHFFRAVTFILFLFSQVSLGVLHQNANQENPTSLVQPEKMEAPIASSLRKDFPEKKLSNKEVIAWAEYIFADIRFGGDKKSSAAESFAKLIAGIKGK